MDQYNSNGLGPGYKVKYIYSNSQGVFGIFPVYPCAHHANRNFWNILGTESHELLLHKMSCIRPS